MKKETKKKSIAGSLLVLCNLLMFAVSFYALYLRGLNCIEQPNALNAGLDIAGMSMGFVLLILCYIDHARTEVDYRLFCVLVELTFLGLFTDLLAWVLNGVPQLRILYLIDNTVFYLMMPTGIYIFWRYVVQIIGKTDPWVEKAELLIRVGCIVESGLCFLNLFAGFFFTVDSSGTYRRGPAFIFFMLYIFFAAAVILVLMIVRRKRLQRRQTIALLVYLITPFPVIFISTFIYGLSLNYYVAMIDILVMYGILNVEQGREKTAVKQELATAASIQKNMLPGAFPLYPERKEFDVFASMDPAKEIGGDFYDIFLIDADHLALVMADVAGKGIPAALYMVTSRTLIKNRAMMGGTPSEILTDVNKTLCEGNKSAMFVTVWFAIVTLSTGVVAEANAGHENPLVRHRSADNARYEVVKQPHDMVIGGLKKARFREDSFVMQPGDQLFIYTDGVTEAKNAEGRMYGMDRVTDALNRNQEAEPEALLSHMREDIDRFVGGADQFDDLTMLSFRYRGPGESALRTLTVPATAESHAAVKTFVDEALEKTGCEKKIRRQINMAVDEIFTNIACYAYGEETGEVTIDLKLHDDPKEMELTFTDSGVAYDPFSAKQPDVSLPGREREIGGLGIFLVRKTMDDTKYEYRDGRNILTIRKNLL